MKRALLLALTRLAFVLGANNESSFHSTETLLPLGSTRTVRVREKEWWHSRVDLSAIPKSSPVAVSVRVLHSEECSEGTSADGSCRFGLKVFGSTRGPKHVDRKVLDSSELVGGAREWQSEGSYALVASACELRAAHNATFHVSIYGWDGTNDVAIVATPITTFIEPFCNYDLAAPTAGDTESGTTARAAVAFDADALLRGSVARVAPSARQGHAAAFLPTDSSTAPNSPCSSTAAAAAANGGNASILGAYADDLGCGSLFVFGGERPYDATAEAGGARAAALSADAARPSAAALSADRVAMSRSDELWRLDLSTRSWEQLRAPEACEADGATGGTSASDAYDTHHSSSHHARGSRRYSPEPTWPPERSGHSLTSAPTAMGPILLLFGGVTDAGIVADLWMYNATVDHRVPTGRAGTRPPSPPPCNQSSPWTRLQVGTSGWRYSSSPNPLDSHSAYGETYLGYGSGYGYSFSPKPRYQHAAIILRSESAADGTSGALLVMGGLSGAPGDEVLGGRRGLAATDVTSLKLRERLGEGMHVLADVWRLGIGGNDGGVVRTWQRLQDRFPPTGEEPARRFGHSIAGLPDGEVFLFGGRVVTETYVGASRRAASLLYMSSDAWIFGGGREGGGEWIPVRSKGGEGLWPAARAFHACEAIGGALLIFGGRGDDGTALADTWLLRLGGTTSRKGRGKEREGTWIRLPSVGGAEHRVFDPVLARVGESSVSLPLSTRVLTFGGRNGHDEMSDVVALFTPAVCPAATAASGVPGGAPTASACIACPAGTRTTMLLSGSQGGGLSATADDENGDAAAAPAATAAATNTTDRRAVCVPCPAGWFSSSPGATECMPCPRGTSYPHIGASSWSFCELCPAGSYAPKPGSHACVPCTVAQLRDADFHSGAPISDNELRRVTEEEQLRWLCPAGASAPSLVHMALLSREVNEQLSLSNFPDVQDEDNNRGLQMQRIQLFVGSIGVIGYIAFLLFLGTAALVQPASVEKLLRSVDVPPISGGQGNSIHGGFVTFTFLFAYSSFFLSLGYQFLFFNDQMDASMLQVSSKHFETTTANYRAELLVVGMPAEHCTAAGAAAASAAFWSDETYKASVLRRSREGGARCAERVALNYSGLVGKASLYNTSDSLYNLSGVPTIACSDESVIAPGGGASADGQEPASACRVTIECRECMVETGKQHAEIGVEIGGRFAMSHGISWEASIRWSEFSDVAGSSTLSGTLTSARGTVLRGEEPSVIELGLLPTVYRNYLNNTRAHGYRLQYDYTTAGSAVAREAIFSTAAKLGVTLRLSPTTNQFTIEVSLFQTWLEWIGQMVSLGSGFAFLSRLSLWAYLKFLNKHAAKLGREAKEGYDELRQRLQERQALKELRRRARGERAPRGGWSLLRSQLVRPSKAGRGNGANGSGGSLGQSSSDTEAEGVGTATAMPRQSKRKTTAAIDTALNFLDSLLDASRRGGSASESSPFYRLRDEAPYMDEDEESPALVDAPPPVASMGVHPLSERATPKDKKGDTSPRNPRRNPLLRQRSAGGSIFGAALAEVAKAERERRSVPSDAFRSMRPNRTLRRANTWGAREGADAIAALRRRGDLAGSTEGGAAPSTPPPHGRSTSEAPHSYPGSARAEKRVRPSFDEIFPGVPTAAALSGHGGLSDSRAAAAAETEAVVEAPGGSAAGSITTAAPLADGHGAAGAVGVVAGSSGGGDDDDDDDDVDDEGAPSSSTSYGSPDRSAGSSEHLAVHGLTLPPKMLPSGSVNSDLAGALADDEAGGTPLHLLSSHCFGDDGGSGSGGGDEEPGTKSKANGGVADEGEGSPSRATSKLKRVSYREGPSDPDEDPAINATSATKNSAALERARSAKNTNNPGSS